MSYMKLMNYSRKISLITHWKKISEVMWIKVWMNGRQITKLMWTKKMRQKNKLWLKNSINQNSISLMLFTELKEQVKDVILLKQPLMLILLLQILLAFFCEDHEIKLFKNWIIIQCSPESQKSCLYW